MTGFVEDDTTHQSTYREIADAKRSEKLSSVGKSTMYLIVMEHLKPHFLSANSIAIMGFICGVMVHEKKREVEISYNHFIDGRNTMTRFYIHGIPGLNNNNLKYELDYLSGRTVTTIRKSSTSNKRRIPKYQFLNIQSRPRHPNLYSLNFEDIVTAATEAGCTMRALAYIDTFPYTELDESA